MIWKKGDCPECGRELTWLKPFRTTMGLTALAFCQQCGYEAKVRRQEAASGKPE